MATVLQPKMEHSDAHAESLRVAYLVSRFPKLTETFVLYEILAMEQLGVAVDIFPLQREKTSVMHEGAARLVEEAHFTPFLSWAILVANISFLLRRPATYLGTLFTLLRANWGSRRYLAGALVFFPKSVYWAAQMEREQIDHVHAHFASHPAAMAFVIHRLTGISYSFTAHGSDLHCDRHMLTEKIAESAFTVTISRYNQDLIYQECDGIRKTPVQVIHCGVNTDEYRMREEKTAFEMGEGPFKIACTGTLHEVKGQRVLIEACWQLYRKGVSVECHFAGDGPDRESLVKLVKQYSSQPSDREQSFESCIHFHGQVRQAELRRLLQKTDVVAAPSVPTSSGRREGIPVALMEALASGLPAVASRLSGIPELIEDGVTGLLFSPGNVDELAEALEELYRDEELRQRLSVQGRAKVEREFDLFRNADLLASRIRDIGESNNK
jgi:glycosyltransferase involved in cell wall biosynthesis